MTHADQHQTFSPDFEKSAPAYLWWNGRRVPWDSATVHLTSTFWSGVTAIFEGIMSYWNEEQHDIHLAALATAQAEAQALEATILARPPLQGALPPTPTATP
jgi:hypothetical protein